MPGRETASSGNTPTLDQGPADADLIATVRAASGLAGARAYGMLYERHVGAARNLARQLARSSAEVDDLVSDAFARVLDVLNQGRGPDTAFRAYLLTALRHGAYDRTRRDRRVEFTDEPEDYDTGVPFTDTAVDGLERSLAARAFATLPERWQAVLWHTEVDGSSPAEVAPLLGMTPNGVSALAYRAREGLRQAYLQVHLAETTADRCRTAVDRLGAWTRGGLGRRETAQVEAHLDECADCRALAAELADVNGGMRGYIAPLVLGIGATGYLATAGSGGTAALVGAGAGAAKGAFGALLADPKNWVPAAASTTVLAAAVAIGLVVAPGDPAPRAASPQPPAASAPTDPADPDPPVPPAVPTPAPAAPPAPPAAPDVPGAAPAVAPVETGAVLGSSGSGGTVELTAGGPSAALPVTVSNDGDTATDPVTVTLALPPGIEAAPSGRSVGLITCTSVPGSARCTTTGGLDPAETAVFTFSLSATPDATGGVITGSIDGGAVTLTLDPITVVVRQPTDPPQPDPTDPAPPQPEPTDPPQQQPEPTDPPQPGPGPAPEPTDPPCDALAPALVVVVVDLDLGLVDLVVQADDIAAVCING